MNRLFFELIQVAIGRRDSLSHVPSADDWSALYSLSVKQAVAGVCFYGVQRLPKEQVVTMPMPLKMQWLAMDAQIQQRNEVMNRRCVELQRKIENEGLKSCILKGQGVAKLYKAYPQPFTNRSGDKNSFPFMGGLGRGC
ncbi:MAG: nucleotidyltransferase family protein [Prevotella sp.]